MLDCKQNPPIQPVVRAGVVSARQTAVAGAAISIDSSTTSPLRPGVCAFAIAGA